MTTLQSTDVNLRSEHAAEPFLKGHNQEKIRCCGRRDGTTSGCSNGWVSKAKQEALSFKLEHIDNAHRQQGFSKGRFNQTKKTCTNSRKIMSVTGQRNMFFCIQMHAKTGSFKKRPYGSERLVLCRWSESDQVPKLSVEDYDSRRLSFEEFQCNATARFSVVSRSSISSTTSTTTHDDALTQQKTMKLDILELITLLRP